MKKMVMVGVVGVMLAGGAQASEGKVEFGFFDTPQTQAKKFEDAFRQNDRITGINIDGRSFSLGGEWVVLNSWSMIEEYKSGGKYGSDGVLVLGKIDGKKLYDTLYFKIALQPPVTGEFRTAISTVCAPKEVPFFSDVSRAEDKNQSCMKIVKESFADKGSDAGRVETAVKGYAAAYGLSIQPNGEKMYDVSVFESKNATAVYANRYVVRDSADPEELKRFAQDLRRSIRRSYFKE